MEVWLHNDHRLLLKPNTQMERCRCKDIVMVAMPAETATDGVVLHCRNTGMIWSTLKLHHA